MSVDILMPALSPTMEEGSLAKWHVKVGDTVRSGDVIALGKKLAGKKFEGVTAELRENILGFYAKMKMPDPHGINTELAALKVFQPLTEPQR